MSRRIAPVALLTTIATQFSVSPIAVLPAQQSGSTIPVELAVAYVRTLGRADSAATVEFLPGDIPAAVRDVVPVAPGARLIGTVVRGRSTTVLGSSTLSPDSVLAWYAAEYIRRRFPAMALVRVQSSPPGIGGFRQPPPAHPAQFCRGADEIDVAAVRSTEGWTDFRVLIAGDSPICRLVPPTPPRKPPAFNLPLPIVYDPPNTGVRPECFVSESSQQSRTQLFTSIPPDSLLRHYGRQLEASGWTRVPAESTSATGLWTRRDSSGTLQAAKLTVGIVPTAPDCRSATLEVSTIRGR
jgi:hypothetical protein